MSAPRLPSLRPSARTREVLALAWPAIVSYTLNNTYRINDQFWIQALGQNAQAAIGANFFLQILSFALAFLAVGGTIALVSRAVGARDGKARDSYARHALAFALGVGLFLTIVVVSSLGPIPGMLGLAGETADEARDYLFHLYLFMGPMAMLSVCDAIFIARGNSRVPMILQAIAIGLNTVLNPLLIYGKDAADAMHLPLLGEVAALARALDIDGMGIGGAALATGIARTLVVLMALALLSTTFRMRLRPMGPLSLRISLGRIGEIIRISGPASASIAVYSIAYILLLRIVLAPMGDAVLAGLGVGFQVFEGISFPCYLGVAMAGSSLVGREIGARNRSGVLEVVHTVRVLTWRVGLFFAALFWFGGPPFVAAFTDDPAVAHETLIYVRTLAFSQVLVAVETANEKILLGSGRTRPILWISPLGNLLRIPLGWLLSGPIALGAAGVWWAINATTGLKAYLFWHRVEHGSWLDEVMAPDPARQPARDSSSSQRA
ncbi:MAG TPA: MATE family efflux transporter [Planctomycetes bacterium]|nr:MATE family efflux transporter [Planctomycetota bacterium]